MCKFFAVDKFILCEQVAKYPLELQTKAVPRKEKVLSYIVSTKAKTPP